MDQGYHNTMFRVPSKEFRDFIEFQQQEVCALAKEMVDIVHSYGKEAMMFLGDHSAPSPTASISPPSGWTPWSARSAAALRCG